MTARRTGRVTEALRRESGLVAIAACWLLLLTFGSRRPPAGIYLSGAVVGALYGMVAIGLVLIHRANRVVNFAQAGLGAAPAVAGLLLYTNTGWPFAVAVAVVVVGALALGSCTERVVVRRFRRRSRPILTVVTIGLAQLLLFVELYLPRWIIGDAQLPIAYRTPLSDWQFAFGGVFFDGNHVAALVAAAGTVAMLGAFLRRTRAGIGIRAVADDEERALTLGIPTARLSNLVWALAAVLSAVGVFLRAAIVGLPVGGLVGPTILLFGLTAAAIGRMEHLPRVLAAAIGLGVLDQTVFYVTGNGNIAIAIALPVLLVALLSGQGATRRGEDTERWQTLDAVRRVPAAVRVRREFQLAGASVAVAATGFACLLPYLFDPGRRDLASLVVIHALLGLSLVVLVGWAGQISLGQMAFAGVGAAVAGKLVTAAGADFVVAVLAAGLVGAALAVLVGIPALRLRGPYLAVVTLALAATVETFVLDRRYFAWLLPSSTEAIRRPVLFGVLDTSDEVSFYFLCLAVLASALVSLWSVRRSRAGRVLLAVRDNPRSAQSYGVSVIRVRLGVFALAGALAGVAGALLAHLNGAVDARTFATARSIELLGMVAIGGFTSTLGALLGAGYVVAFRYNLPDFSLLATGGGMLVVLAVAPGGFSAALVAVRDRFVRQLPGGAERGAAAGEGLGMPDAAQSMGSASTGSAGALDDTGTALLRCEGIEVAYGGVQVLFGVDLRVAPGEIVALLGTNGAGKSTLLRAVSGLSALQGGTIGFEGRAVERLGPTARVDAGLALVSGGRGVFTSLSVEENLRLAGWLHDGDRPDAGAASMAAAYERFPPLAHRRWQPAGDLSGGEQQMLAIAMALRGEPKLLAIDELSLGLAPAVVGQLLETLRAVRAAGTAVLLVEQSLNVALGIADRAYFLEKGAVRFEGPTAELAARDDLVRSVFLHAPAGDAVPTVRHAAPRQRTEVSPVGPALEVRDLSVHFGGIVANDGVDLDVAPGEILGVIGPNGAGKTTLFDLVSGFLRPDRGEVILEGVDVSGWSPDARARRGLGRSFQDARIFGDLTVAENLAVALDRHLPVHDQFGAALLLPAIRELEVDIAWSVDDLLTTMGLQGYRDALAASLSTGTRRIVDLAMAVAHRPSVLLLDEPSSGVAQRETEALVALLHRIRDVTGAAIVVIDHDMPLVRSVSDRVVAMELGRVLTTGTPDEVLNDPGVVASYLGSDDTTIERSGRLASAVSVP